MKSGKTSRRAFLKGMVGTGVAVLLAGCTPPATSVPPTAVPPTAVPPTAVKPVSPTATTAAVPTQAPTVISSAKTGVFWFNQPAQADAFKKIVDKFHADQSKYKIEVVLVPQAELQTKLATAIAAGDPPDAVRLHAGSTLVQLFASKGQLAALDDWDPKINSYDWIPDLVKGVSYKGKMYAVPVNSGCLGFLYNKDLYKASGLDPEKPPQTLDELVEYSLKIVKPAEQILGHYMFTAPDVNTGGDNFDGILWGFGGQEVSDDGKKVVFNSPEGVAALQWYHDLVYKHKIMPVKKIDELTSLNDFLTGKLGSFCAFPSVVGSISTKATFNAASSFIPAGPKGRKIPIGFGSIAVLANAKNKDAGWEFAKFVGLVAENDALWCMGFGQLPTRFSYREVAIWKDYVAKTPLVQGYLEGQKYAMLPYSGPGASGIKIEKGKAVEAVVFNQKTPKQALDDAAAAAQIILDRELKAAGG